MDMQIDEMELEDMRDDALALAKGVLDLLEAAQAAAGTGVQLGEEGLGALVSEQERVVSAIAAIARPGASSLRVNAVKMLFKIKNGENRQQTFK